MSPSRPGPDSHVASRATYVTTDHTSVGSCPGGGKCNGTGGAKGCSGCPAFNNRVSKSAHVSVSQQSPAPSQSQNDQPTDAPSPIDVATLNLQNQNTTVVVACQNCGTTITPLWRRDESGHTICNACGMLRASSALQRVLILFFRTVLQTPRCTSPCNHEKVGDQTAKTCCPRNPRNTSFGG